MLSGDSEGKYLKIPPDLPINDDIRNLRLLRLKSRQAKTAGKYHTIYHTVKDEMADRKMQQSTHGRELVGHRIKFYLGFHLPRRH